MNVGSILPGMGIEDKAAHINPEEESNKLHMGMGGLSEVLSGSYANAALGFSEKGMSDEAQVMENIAARFKTLGQEIMELETRELEVAPEEIAIDPSSLTKAIVAHERQVVEIYRSRGMVIEADLHTRSLDHLERTESEIAEVRAEIDELEAEMRRLDAEEDEDTKPINPR